MMRIALPRMRHSAIINQMGAKHITLTLLVALFLVACGGTEAPSTPATVTSVVAAQPTAAEPASLPPPVTTSTPLPTATPSPAPMASPTATSEPSPTLPPPSPTPLAISEEAEAEAVLALLQGAEPPVRDDARLAAAFLGAELDELAPAATPPPWEVGAMDSFYVGNVDSNTVEQITAELLHVSDRAYYWFDTADPTPIDPTALAAEAAEFDIIFGQVAEFFAEGGEGDDRRVHVVHVSPLSLCDVTADTADLCRLAGYFSPRDLLPAEVNARTNGREMFVMNVRQFGRSSYLDVLAHELRHMLEARYDLGDEDWAVEGSAMLAAELAGHEASAQARANLFLATPDQQLNSWSETEQLLHYGQGYLFSRYLFDRLGAERYRQLAVSPASGLRAIDVLAEEVGAEWTAESLWQDWLVTLAVQPEVAGDGRFEWQGPPLNPPASTAIDAYPAEMTDTVNQYAADYYRLAPSGELTLSFAGAPEVNLLGVDAFDGDRLWYALRDNYANPRLTRTFDLRDVESATLEYAVYADIEEGYDFAYVSASTDGGRTWQPLVAAGMQGDATVDDPSDSAMADRFYTGRSEAWLEERIDLTPFAGEEVAIRFDYITDPVLTYDGLALDNIAVPEIGFFDDAESDAGEWTVDGFVRAPGALAQTWHLILVTSGPDGPQVQFLNVGEDGSLTETIRWDSPEAATLIVAASAPRTLTPAAYELTLSQKAGE